MRVGKRYSNTVSRIDQNIVNLFIKEGYYERHLNKMRGIYKAKHDILLGRTKKIRCAYDVAGESAGLHVLLSTDEFTENELVRMAAQERVRVYPLSEHFLNDDISYDITRLTGKKSTIILGYARLNEEEIVRGIVLLMEAFSNEKNL